MNKINTQDTDWLATREIVTHCRNLIAKANKQRSGIKLAILETLANIPVWEGPENSLNNMNTVQQLNDLLMSYLVAQHLAQEPIDEWAEESDARVYMSQPEMLPFFVEPEKVPLNVKRNLKRMQEEGFIEYGSDVVEAHGLYARPTDLGFAYLVRYGVQTLSDLIRYTNYGFLTAPQTFNMPAPLMYESAWGHVDMPDEHYERNPHELIASNIVGDPDALAKVAKAIAAKDGPNAWKFIYDQQAFCEIFLRAIPMPDMARELVMKQQILPHLRDTAAARKTLLKNLADLWAELYYNTFHDGPKVDEAVTEIVCRVAWLTMRAALDDQTGLTQAERIKEIEAVRPEEVDEEQMAQLIEKLDMLEEQLGIDIKVTKNKKSKAAGVFGESQTEAAIRHVENIQFHLSDALEERDQAAVEAYWEDQYISQQIDMARGK